MLEEECPSVRPSVRHVIHIIHCGIDSGLDGWDLERSMSRKEKGERKLGSRHQTEGFDGGCGEKECVT